MYIEFYSIISIVLVLTVNKSNRHSKSHLKVFPGK